MSNTSFEISDKGKFISKIDFLIGKANYIKIDEHLEFLSSGEHCFDSKFIKFVLGYTKIQQPHLKKWEQLRLKTLNK